MIVLDESGSVGSTNYKITKDFINDITTYMQTEIDSGDVRVGVMSFARSVRYQIPLRKYSYADLFARVNRISYSRGGTYLGKAIYSATSRFSSASSSGRTKVLLIITDGKSYDNPSTPANNARYIVEVSPER